MAARSLALVSLILGVLSLPTAGGMGLGALAGLAAGILAFTRLRRAGTRPGQKLAVAGIVLNLAAAVVAVPLAGLLLALYEDGRLAPAPEPVGAEPEAPRPASSAPLASGRDTGGTDEDPEPVRSDPELKEPRKLHHVAPVYPEDARRAGVEGTVVLEAVIGRDGAVQSVKVVRTVPQLDEAALEAARQWRYEPTVLRGRRVPIVLTVTINFRLR